jgi:Putative adhesin
MWVRVSWLATGALVTVVTILAGAATAGLWLARQTETQHRTYDLDTTQIGLDLPGVDVAVVAGQPGLLRVERRLAWATSKPVTREHWDGHALAVDAECSSLPIGPRCDVIYTLWVPPRADLAIRTGSGDLRATGLGAAVLSVHTGSGDVELHFVEPPRRLDIETGSGDVEVTVPSSAQYRVDSDADQPSVTVPQDPQATHVITVHTGSGSLRVRATTVP